MTAKRSPSHTNSRYPKTSIDSQNTSLLSGLDGGAYPPLALLARFGLAASVGSGAQPFPWVHIKDTVAAIMETLTHVDKISGVFNLAAPNSVSNAQFTTQLARSFHRPHLLPNIPAPIVRAVLGKERAAMALGGSPVSCDKLLQTGFKFKFPQLKEALDDLALQYKHSGRW